MVTGNPMEPTPPPRPAESPFILEKHYKNARTARAAPRSLLAGTCIPVRPFTGSPSAAHGESAQLECWCVFRRDDGEMREETKQANPTSIIHKRPRLSGLNVMFNVVDACDARSDNARREIPGDCSRNSRNWRHAIN
ncbi:hypothetical protein ALC60_04713 [Trachymyrmex zeteki]|uniref:Uncharacterized protein n=1 Tax=Mycetomoellerius zeteki TaxID=64791 RepID=A0A151X7F5_9HYME|nr:hypothetical protein ALC60_04713 [Trachymyrmex zeteki]